ncbi:43351_t:CDS:2 [Gigaspora margarita]|uniref:43351_t:CDS:1 n=1 Tax=Gigaspora margarita TaxID=4874 RepID=A0ABN7UGQ3_GIGMA|nr:43351_t:CDS:2 [Gigaspora margarita]
MDINEENKNLDKYKKQLSFINMIFDGIIFVTKNKINYQEMIYQYEKHNAYTSHNIKWTAKTNSTRTINLTSINSNQASHIVSLFTKNTNTKMQFIKQREKDEKIIKNL